MAAGWPRGSPASAPGECCWFPRPGIRERPHPPKGIVALVGRAGEPVKGAQISISCLKKKKVHANLHHDFLPSVGEGGLPAWSCLIWSLRSRTNVCALGAAPHSSLPVPTPRRRAEAQALEKVVRVPPCPSLLFCALAHSARALVRPWAMGGDTLRRLWPWYPSTGSPTLALVSPLPEAHPVLLAVRPLLPPPLPPVPRAECPGAHSILHAAPSSLHVGCLCWV